MLDRFLVVLVLPTFYPLVQVLWGSRLVRVLVVELLELLWTAHEVPCWVLSRVKVLYSAFGSSLSVTDSYI